MRPVGAHQARDRAAPPVGAERPHRACPSGRACFYAYWEDARAEWRFPLRSLPSPLPINDREERFVAYRRGPVAEDGAVLYTLIGPSLS